MLHGHLDVVPARAEQFTPRVEGDRLYGRGAYDMKGAPRRDDGRARRSCASSATCASCFGVVPDEESEEEVDRGTEFLIRTATRATSRSRASRRTCTSACRPRACSRCGSRWRQSAHGATPWLGDNAILKALDAFRAIESLPFARESSDLFDRPSINLGRILGGDALNKVPDSCMIDVDIRYLPGQDPADIRRQVSAACRRGGRAPVPSRSCDRGPQRSVRSRVERCVSRVLDSETISVGRDGASDAICFIAAGVPGGRVRPGRGGPSRTWRMGLDLLARELPASRSWTSSPVPEAA